MTLRLTASHTHPSNGFMYAQHDGKWFVEDEGEWYMSFLSQDKLRHLEPIKGVEFGKVLMESHIAPLKLELRTTGMYRVSYGVQVTEYETMYEAMKEFHECNLHSIGRV